MAKYTQILIFVIFVIFGLPFAVAIIFSKACFNEKIDDNKRKIYCTISITASSPFQIDNRRRANIYLERGLILADAFEYNLARRDFVTAIEFASSATDARHNISRNIADLQAQVSRQDVKLETLTLWGQILSEQQRKSSK